jgi:predicted acetyltransferase
MLYLKEICYTGSKEEYEFISSLKGEKDFENPYYDMSPAEYEKTFLTKRINSKNGMVRAGFVPDTYFLLFNDDIIVGMFKIRHYLNDKLREGTGHIGFCIKENFRHQGFATFGLELALKALKMMPDLKENEAYLSCFKDNDYSIKAMLKNKAIIDHEKDDKVYLKIKL